VGPEYGDHEEHQDGRAEHAAECRAAQVGAGRQSIDLLHQKFLAALQIRDVGSQLVGGAKGEAGSVFVGHDWGMLTEHGCSIVYVRARRLHLAPTTNNQPETTHATDALKVTHAEYTSRARRPDGRDGGERMTF
jgi:hypothetical protein